MFLTIAAVEHRWSRCCGPDVHSEWASCLSISIPERHLFNIFRMRSRGPPSGSTLISDSIQLDIDTLLARKVGITDIPETYYFPIKYGGGRSIEFRMLVTIGPFLSV